jgi:hypothetical protein
MKGRDTVPALCFPKRLGDYAAPTGFARRLFRRAAAFLWMSPFRAALSSSCTASVFTSGDASGAAAFLSAVRSAERWERLRMAAARDFRMFFFAEAILGTKLSRYSRLMGAI